MLLAAALPWVSKDTYRDMTTTLRGGIALTDARIQTNRLLALRFELLRNLELAATQLQQARTSIYDALLVNREAVGSRSWRCSVCSCFCVNCESRTVDVPGRIAPCGWSGSNWKKK